MRPLRLTIIALLLLLSGCGGSSDDSGAQNTSPSIRWKSFPIPLYADSALTQDPSANQDLQDAIAFWEQNAGKQLFDFKGNPSGPAFSGDENDPSNIFFNTILLLDPWPLDQQGIVGKTHIHTRENFIDKSIIFLDKNVNYCANDCSVNSSGLSRRKLMAHELGHFLGLDHVNNTNNVMYYEIRPGGNLDSLELDTAALKILTN